jgi:glutamate racemase
MTSSAAIGVIDSGLGGLSVLAAIRSELPRESLVFVADHAHLPYGERDVDTIRARVLELGRGLAGSGCKALVLACNTATAAAAEPLRARADCPVVGMEPAIKPASKATRSGVIGVLGTGGTLASARFAGLLGRYAGDKRVVTRPSPELVALAETGRVSGARARGAVDAAVAPLVDAGADVIVLGCTHFPLLRGEIERAAGRGVAVVDTGAAVARELHRRLAAHEALAPGDGPVTARFHTTGEPARVGPPLARLWPGAMCRAWSADNRVASG